jgi:tRNA(fMet)-specific endonuclease VapC
MRYGALHSARAETNLVQVQTFLELCAVIEVSLETSIHYANARQSLAIAGLPIPEADLWIAAICIEYELPLLTNDGHFQSVPGLQYLNPTQLPAEDH